MRQRDADHGKCRLFQRLYRNQVLARGKSSYMGGETSDLLPFIVNKHRRNVVAVIR